jgi:hypothetical protein
VAWHDIVVSFKVFAQKGFIGTWIFWVKGISERITWNNDSHSIGGHAPILASHEQLALRGLSAVSTELLEQACLSSNFLLLS